MRSNRAPVNTDHYGAAVVFLILAASVAALLLGTAIGQGLMTAAKPGGPPGCHLAPGGPGPRMIALVTASAQEPVDSAITRREDWPNGTAAHLRHRDHLDR
jgi:hypothetical protein